MSGSVLAALGSEAVFKTIELGLLALDMMDAAGVNAEVLRAERERAKNEGRKFDADDVARAFDRMGASRDDLDALLNADPEELTDVVDPGVESGEGDEGETPAAPV